MNKIGIICASDTELEPLLHKIEIIKTTEKAMLKFYEGKIGDVTVIVLYSGVCKVNAAIATEILIDSFGINVVINAGTAGGMDANVQLFDTVISEQCAYHDVADGILTDFHPWMETVYFPSNPKLLKIAREYALTSNSPILFGTTVTGEQFIEDEKRAEINQKFSPLSTDMETASIAHVCYVNQIPFLAVRTITDTADHSGIENFEKNCEDASLISANIVIDLVKAFVSTAVTQ